jgi:hypothetical protein
MLRIQLSLAYEGLAFFGRLLFGDLMDQMVDKELLQKLVIEVRAKNGMTPNRMNRALERLAYTDVMANSSQS